MSKYLSISLLLCCFCFYPLFAQDSKIRSEAQRLLDSISGINEPKQLLRVDALRLGMDMSYIGSGLLRADKGKTYFEAVQHYFTYVQRGEVTADLGLNNNLLFVSADLGYSNITRQSPLRDKKAYSYQNQGFYWRAGVDYNLMKRYFNQEVLYVGLRFAQSYFRHSLSYREISDPWGRPYDPQRPVTSGYFNSIEEKKLSATWVELVTGLKVNLWKNWGAGYAIRIKIRTSVKGEQQLKANDIPGFGFSDTVARLGLNYYLYYRFAFRKRPEVIID